MKVSIAVVAYNEERYLGTLLNCIKRQDYPHEKIEVLLIDSNSKDGTKALMEAFQKENNGFAAVQVLDNPGQFLPQGCNVMLQHYTGDAICRIDAHATIPENFIRANVAVLEAGESVSGGPRPNIVDEESSWRHTLLLAEQSRFGSGAANYRSLTKKCYVDSIFHGMYRREVYDKVGLYNERLKYTEDNDMSYRIRQAGFPLCYDPSICSYEHIRPSFKQMLKQKFRNGLWIGKTLKINPNCFSLFHFVPAVFVAGILVTSILSGCGFPWLSVALWGLYFLCAIYFTIKGSITDGFRWTNLALPGLFLAMHLFYGAGTIIGVFSKA